MQTLAIIGAGIAGLGAARFLRRRFEITVFEAGSHAGGHACTVEVDEEDQRVPVDTGFMVFNHVTYPNLTRLFRMLDVETKPTDMSFSVQNRRDGLEYSGSSLNHLFAQRRNLLRPSFYRMLLQVDRFNREAVAALADPSLRELSLEEYVAKRGYGEAFFRSYLIPMSSAVWSTPPEKMLRFPASTLLRFFHNHGFLGLHTQHPWWTVEGGSKRYVERLIAPYRERILLNTPVQAVRRAPGSGIQVQAAGEWRTFDRVLFACHAPTALEILGAGATAEERHVLSPFRYQPNTAILHTDERVMPKTRLAWSSWNYRMEEAAEESADAQDRKSGSGAPGGGASPSLGLKTSTHYWMNRLQGVSKRTNYFVSIEGAHIPAPESVRRVLSYEHPLFDLRTQRAQDKLAALNATASGRSETYFAGAWQRYGFHEDGLHSALDVSTLLLGDDPWKQL